MSERKTSNFIPKWARDGKWEWAEDFPPVGVPDEPDEPEPAEPTKEELQAEVDRLRGLLREFCAETRTDLEQFEEDTRWLGIATIAGVWLVIGLVVAIISAASPQ